MSTRQQYRSIPLRRHAQRPRTTDAVPTTQAPKTPSYISRAALPSVPDEESRLALAPKSSIRYDTQGNMVVRQGNKQLIIHPTANHQPRRPWHWSVYAGAGMTLASLLFAGLSWGVSAWQTHALTSQYGDPPTYQINAVVGHEDSAAHPSHFIFENLSGHVIIIELPGGNIAHAHIYGGPTIFSSSADQVPVTGSFKDSNHNGRPEMLVTIGTGDSQETITFTNNGTLFVPQQ